LGGEDPPSVVELIAEREGFRPIKALEQPGSTPMYTGFRATVAPSIVHFTDAPSLFPVSRHRGQDDKIDP
jgi:hypothetical protein